MTHDFIDDFSEALEREKRGYVICVHGGNAPGAHVRWDLDHWPEVEKEGGKEKDAAEAICAALSSDTGVSLTVLCEEERSRIVGALDVLANALTEKGHTWTEAERAIYEQALEILTVPPTDNSDESP